MVRCVREKREKRNMENHSSLLIFAWQGQTDIFNNILNLRKCDWYIKFMIFVPIFVMWQNFEHVKVIAFLNLEIQLYLRCCRLYEHSNIAIASCIHTSFAKLLMIYSENYLFQFSPYIHIHSNTTRSVKPFNNHTIPHHQPIFYFRIECCSATKRE